MSSWEDEIQLNREQPALPGEMRVSQAGGTKITKNKGVRGAWEKPRGKGAGSKIKLSAFDGRRADTEEKKRGTPPEVDPDVEIV